MSTACLCRASSFGSGAFLGDGFAVFAEDSWGVEEGELCPTHQHAQAAKTVTLAKRTNGFMPAIVEVICRPAYFFASICKLMLGYSRSSNWLSVLVELLLPSFWA